MADLIVMSAKATEEDINRVVEKIKSLGFQVNISKGEEKIIIGIIGDTRGLSDENFKLLPGVVEVISILKDYKLASREFHPENTVIKIDGVEIGGEEFVMIAGPCAVESEEQVLKTAEFLKNKKCKILRGGAFKPRTSPYSFQGGPPREPRSPPPPYTLGGIGSFS